MSYLTQIRLLSEASSKIQDAINDNTNDIIAKGKMYATQDLLSAQIATLSHLEDGKNHADMVDHTEYDFLAN